MVPCPVCRYFSLVCDGISLLEYCCDNLDKSPSDLNLNLYELTVSLSILILPAGATSRGIESRSVRSCHVLELNIIVMPNQPQSQSLKAKRIPTRFIEKEHDHHNSQQNQKFSTNNEIIQTASVEKKN